MTMISAVLKPVTGRVNPRQTRSMTHLGRTLQSEFDAKTKTLPDSKLLFKDGPSDFKTYGSAFLDPIQMSRYLPSLPLAQREVRPLFITNLDHQLGFKYSALDRNSEGMDRTGRTEFGFVQITFDLTSATQTPKTMMMLNTLPHLSQLCVESAAVLGAIMDPSKSPNEIGIIIVAYRPQCSRAENGIHKDGFKAIHVPVDCWGTSCVTQFGRGSSTPKTLLSGTDLVAVTDDQLWHSATVEVTDKTILQPHRIMINCTLRYESSFHHPDLNI